MKKVNMLWSSLASELKDGGSSVDNTTLFLKCTSWLRRHLKELDKALVTDYGLPFYCEIDVRDYAIAGAAVDSGEEIEAFVRVNPTGMDPFIASIRNLLWSLVAYESSKECPRCDASMLRVLFDATREQIVLACDQCGWAQTLDGNELMGASQLTPATIYQVHDAGLYRGT